MYIRISILRSLPINKNVSCLLTVKEKRGWAIQIFENFQINLRLGLG
jgi:hypothetical protein